jgi:hypothetical protein
MNVIGYRSNADFNAARDSLVKHTAFSASDIRHILQHIEEGNAVKLPDDFVLREDLEDNNFLIS